MSSAETLAADLCLELPDIHVWMSPEEAAETLSTSLSAVDQQLDQGDMESRVNDGGELQVLICLPKRAKPEPTVIERVNTLPAVRGSIGDGMLPLVQAMRQTQGDDRVRRARRAARWAWAAAAAILLAAGGTAALSVTAAMRARNLAASASEKLADATSQQTQADGDKSVLLADKTALAAADESLTEANAELSAKLQELSADRDRLKGQLAQANDALHKREDELAVERNVEDQLINAALASHVAKAGLARNQVVADGSN